MAHIRSTINNILNEINDVNSMLNMSHLLPKDLNNDNNTIDNATLTTIKSCDSVEQFVNKYNNSQSDDNGQLGDNELLIMIKNHQHMLLTTYDQVYMDKMEAYRVETDSKKLNYIQNQIETCFSIFNIAGTPMLAPKPRAPMNTKDGIVVSVADTGIALLSLGDIEWRTFKDAKSSFIGTYNSVVYARGALYAFGGRDSHHSTQSSRFKEDTGAHIYRSPMSAVAIMLRWQ
ncbi:hypothetical protein SAMD00019534_054350 [Acytostelium subglobosum LB1]|uniref:hypothetical protein n=1 Tax=Acytostelium subglobosum LB1 TaxID=1410327 RepID=UPI000644AF92|nr:hypothetical protein SAMD00019534_054350 [Acytostelium subglobosum LB1]GAM22260.1 hypothetical protein SAMD00019534_054350 [Acytostelium subglobosum LB1]|eukprot:XP_012754380.1 hypothetical protein SAMD00019534_054350 [Acytostelium subglobosum LB1]